MIEPFEDHWPQIDESAFVASSADLIGRVKIGKEASVWYNSTLRGDIHEIEVGPRSNVQDNAVLHVESNQGCYLGELVTVGHGAIVHACQIGNEVLVGMGATVLDGAIIGERCIIGQHSDHYGHGDPTGFSCAWFSWKSGSPIECRGAGWGQGVGREICRK